MAGAYPNREQEEPSKGGDGLLAQPAVPHGSVIDFSLRSTRLDELEDVLCKAVTDHKLAPMARESRFDGGFQFHGTSDFGIFNVSFGSQVAADLGPEEDEDRLGFAIATRGKARLLLRQEEFTNNRDTGIVFSSGPTRTLHFTDDCECRAIILNRYKIKEICAKLLGHDFRGHVEFAHQLPFNTAAGQNWLRLFDYARLELSNSQSYVRHVPSAHRQLEQMVITGFLFAHRHSYSEALLRPQSPAAPFYVKRAEAFIEAHFAEPLSLADIAAHAGVSARSLQNGFQSFRNVAPMAFLRQVRLQHVQRALLAADPAQASVTEIALACGFGHIGEFASLYRRTFGVTPRHTLLKKT